jgi:methyl-accepting chemotaxis protein
LITEGKEKVETGTHVAQQCGEVLDEIVSNVSNVAQMMTEIAASSREQSQGVQEITKAMGQLDQVTQENAATSEEAASAAEELSSQADSLRGTINTLIETIKGNNNQGVNQHESQDSSSANISQNKEAQRLTSQAHHSNANGSSKVVHLQRAMNKMGIDKKTAEKGVGQDPVISNGNGTGKKKVVGLENGLIPSEEDPRFKDV